MGCVRNESARSSRHSSAHRLPKGDPSCAGSSTASPPPSTASSPARTARPHRPRRLLADRRQDYLQHLAAELPEILPVPARCGARRHRRRHPLRHRPGRPPDLRDRPPGRPHRRLPPPAAPRLLPDHEAEPGPGGRTGRHRPGRNGTGAETHGRRKDIWLFGGSELAGALYPEIDQLIIKLGPLTIGTGLPLFSPGHPLRPPHLGTHRPYGPPERRGLPDLRPGRRGLRPPRSCPRRANHSRSPARTGRAGGRSSLRNGPGPDARIERSTNG